jgi:single-strand DNA-binding protein
MEITGRITADAKVVTLTDGREVANFTIVLNDRFTTKAGERREVATFIKCAYWVSAKVAPYLKKGGIISVYGRIGLDVYKNSEGNPKGSLTFHVNDVRLITAPPKQEAKAVTADATETAPAPIPETIDDLPF